MFYVRSATGLSDNIEECFGTTAPIANLPEFQPTVFAFMEDLRSTFLKYRVESVKFPTAATTNISPSIMCNAVEYDTRGKPGDAVIYKIFFLTNEESYDMLRLLYESQVYRYITMNLCWVTRCFVPWYNTFMFQGYEMDPLNWSPAELKVFQDTLSKTHLPAFKQLFGYFAKEKAVKNIFAQVTRREVGDMTLDKALRPTLFSDRRNTLHSDGLLLTDFEGMRQIIFQVIFALACMAQLKIQHNDLHLGNILIGRHRPTGLLKTLTQAKGRYDIGYYFQGKLYTIPDQKYQVRLYDWDHAYIPSMGKNYGLSREHLKQFGLGNEVNPRYDLFTFLMLLKQEYQAYETFGDEVSLILKFINDIIDPSIQKHTVQSRLCKKDNSGNCVPLSTDELAKIKLPDMALQHDYFKKFRREKYTYKIVETGMVNFTITA
jgi:hypothetical protein